MHSESLLFAMQTAGNNWVELIMTLKKLSDCYIDLQEMHLYFVKNMAQPWHIMTLL